MNTVLIVVVAVCALALVAVLLNRRSRAAEDGVAEFRRQLGALSPDASRPVIRPHRSPEADEQRVQHMNEDEHGA